MGMQVDRLFFQSAKSICLVSLGVIVTSGVFLMYGGTPDEILASFLKRLWETPPEWLMSWQFRSAISILGLVAIALASMLVAFRYGQFVREYYQSDEVILVRRAIEYLLNESKWRLLKSRSPRGEIIVAALALRQEARSGKLEIEGRPEIHRDGGAVFSHTWDIIPPDHWLTHEFDLAALWRDDPHWPVPETCPQEVSDQKAREAPCYTGLRVKRGRLELFWPRRSKFDELVIANTFFL